MPRKTEEPKFLGEDSHGEKSYSHPAVGQVTVHRMSGADELYDVDFQANGCVRVELFESELRRSYARDWHFARKRLAAFDFSEAQWATFVSSFGVGSGVPCTIRVKETNWDIPGIQKEPQEAVFKAEVRDKLSALVERVDSLVKEFKGAKPSATMRNEMVDALEKVRMELAANLPFVADQFDEHVEKTVEKAKAEVHGYAQATLQRLGMDGLQKLNAAQLSKAIEDGRDPD